MNHDPKIVEVVRDATREAEQRYLAACETTGRFDYREQHRAIASAALTALCTILHTTPEAMAAMMRGEAQVMPKEATEAMIDAPRGMFLGAFSTGQLSPSFTLGDLLGAGGYPTAGLTPEDLGCSYLPTKAHRARLVYRAMLAASPFAQGGSDGA